MRTFLLFLLSFAALPVGASAATLTTTFVSDNGQSGNMFDVTNLSVTSIDLLGTFAVNIDTGTPAELISVYYRPGTYVGFESSAAGWILWGTDTVTSLGTDVATPIDIGSTLALGAGQTFGLFITMTTTTSMNYTNGANVYSDGTLQITTGVGKGLPSFTGGTFTPRSWNGSIDYDTGLSSVPEPTTWTLMLGGVAALASMRRRREQR